MFKTLHKQVLYCLDKYPDTRNSDIDLTIRLWKIFYKSKLIPVNFELHINIKDLFELPREDNVKRVRAHIQNDLKKYPPTDWVIAKKRGWLQNDWKNYLGYTQEAVVKAKVIEKQNDLFNVEDLRR